MPPLEELWHLIKRVPHGKVISYGELGKALHNPASGYFVGRWIANCPADVPWWRVVAKSGQIPLNKRSASLGIEQEQRLREEGVDVQDGIVDKTVFVYATDVV